MRKESEGRPMNEQPNPDASKLEALQNARKQITRSLLLATAALGVIAFACYAWFVNNTSVTGSLGSVSAKGSIFELASIGSDSVFTSDTPESYRVENGSDWHNKDGKYTAGKSAIVWQLDSTSHLNNIEGITEQGIRPGSFGTLQFYVIPKIDGSLNLQFDLELIPVLNSDSNLTVNTDTLNQLMHGHMLFSYQCEKASNSGKTLIPLENPSFTMNFDNVNVDQEILVTMKWIWPNLLADVKGDNLQGVCDGEGIVGLMETIPSYFFYNEGNAVTAPNLEDDFQVYNNYFNAADQYLGERINWLIVRMTAQTA